VDSRTDVQAGQATESATSQSSTVATIASEALNTSYDAEDLDPTWDAATASLVTLTGDSIRFDGVGAKVEGSIVTVTEPGTYVISGVLDDGQVRVDSDTDGTVRLVLNSATISCSDSAAIYVLNSEKTILTLAPGTDNELADGSQYAQQDVQASAEDADSDEPNAAIFSKDDLTVNGLGSLTVQANLKNGIVSRDDLKFTGGSIIVSAVNDAIKGKDCVGIAGGDFIIEAGADGIQATNDTETDKGFIAIEGGSFDIVAGGDAVQAATTLAVAGGDFTMTTGGGSNNGRQHPQGFGRDTVATVTTDTSASAKGLKADSGVFVTGGSFTIDSADDSVHSNGNVQISGGSFGIDSGDDGIHADGALRIDGGEIVISKSYEGIEGMTVTINDGTIHVISSDDGINVAGGTDGSAQANFPGGGGGRGDAGNADNILTINGGYIALDAGGDGLDTNGYLYITDGTIIVNGPTNDGNGALDYMGIGQVTGGFLVAVGSSGMAEVPDTSSTICSIMVNFSSVQQAGTLVHIESADGENIVTIAPSKQYQSIVVSSADIRLGETYKVYLGGSSTGTLADTVYTGGSYSPGTEYVGLTIEDVVTTSGQAGGFGGMPGGPNTGPGVRPGR